MMTTEKDVYKTRSRANSLFIWVVVDLAISQTRDTCCWERHLRGEIRKQFHMARPRKNHLLFRSLWRVEGIWKNVSCCHVSRRIESFMPRGEFALWLVVDGRLSQNKSRESPPTTSFPHCHSLPQLTLSASLIFNSSLSSVTGRATSIITFSAQLIHFSFSFNH